MNDQYTPFKIIIDSILKVSKQTSAIAMHSECQLLHDSIFSSKHFCHTSYFKVSAVRCRLMS